MAAKTDRPSWLTELGPLLVCVVFTVIGVLIAQAGDRRGYVAGGFFALCAIIALVFMIWPQASPGRNCPEGQGLYPECLFVVTVSESDIVNRRPDGTIERVTLSDLEEVTIVTNDSGPRGSDVWWLLVGSTPHAGCAFPGGATGESQVLACVQRLPGFDNGTFIEAMTCTSNARFVCWRASNRPPR